MKRAGALNVELLDAMEKDIVDTMEAKSGALVNTARLWDDGIIDPRDTRSIVAFALDICREADTRQLNTNSFGVARF